MHEVYLRLASEGAKWNGPVHYFGAAARAMRRILVERARSKARLKRGGALVRVELDGQATLGGDDAGLLDLDAALAEFEREHERAARGDPPRNRHEALRTR